MTADFDEESFAHVVAALAPYLDDVVFVGGWAFRLFRLHPLAQVPSFRPLMTKDADIAVPARLRRRSQTIRELLLNAKFKEELSGEFRPPRTEYHLADGSGGVYVQFLTPLFGGQYRRDGSPDATTVIAGITAEKLRHVDLLLTAPWTVELSESSNYPVGAKAVPIKICNPVSYLAQKLLSLPQRGPDTRGKDILYLHDTLLLFGGALEDLRAIWVDSVRPALADRARRGVVQASEALFSRITDDAREAADVARSSGARNINVETLVAVCRRGLSEVFIP